MNHPVYNTRKSGFTLIELSIVLVIIGLIVGGVLMGKDLIEAAQNRATISQIQKYNSAVNTFKNKYGALPGDISPTQAAQFGLLQFTAMLGMGYGDANGLIQSAGGPTNECTGEAMMFWRHLSEARLIEGSYGVTGSSALTPGDGRPVGTPVTNVSQSIPLAKIRDGHYFIVYGGPGGYNYFQLASFTSLEHNLSACNYIPDPNGLNPAQTYALDAKMDDGKPNSGSVIARGIGGAAFNPAAASYNAVSTPSTCTMGAAASPDYNMAKDTGGADPSCSVRMQLQ